MGYVVTRLVITRSILIYTLLHKCESRVTRIDRGYKLAILNDNMQSKTLFLTAFDPR